MLGIVIHPAEQYIPGGSDDCFDSVAERAECINLAMATGAKIINDSLASGVVVTARGFIVAVLRSDADAHDGVAVLQFDGIPAQF